MLPYTHKNAVPSILPSAAEVCLFVLSGLDHKIVKLFSKLLFREWQDTENVHKRARRRENLILPWV